MSEKEFEDKYIGKGLRVKRKQDMRPFSLEEVFHIEESLKKHPKVRQGSHLPVDPSTIDPIIDDPNIDPATGYEIVPNV